MSAERIECPACSFRLSGTRFTGYRCVKCHAHYSARFVMQMRKLHIKNLINKHFSLPPTITERSDVIVEDTNGEIEKIITSHDTTARAFALEELRERPSVIEEFVDLSAIPKAVSAISSKKTTVSPTKKTTVRKKVKKQVLLKKRVLRRR